jgi:hypothetical protein
MKEIDQRRDDGRMFVLAMVDLISGNQRRDYDRGDSRAELIEGKSELPALRTGRPCGRRGDVIVEPAVFIIEDDKQAAFPERGPPERFVGPLDQEVPGHDASKGMLRAAALVIRKDVVARFDECVCGIV